MTNRFHTAGLVWVQGFLLDSAGVMAGQKGTAWAAGETTPSFVVKGRRDATFTYDQGTTTPIEEGNEVVGNWRWGGSVVNEIVINVSDYDRVLRGLVGGTSTTTTAPSSYFLFDTDEERYDSRPGMGWLLTEQSQDADGVDGTRTYINHLILNSTARIQNGNMGFQDKNQRVLTITPSTSTTTPFGMALSTFALGVNRGKVTVLTFNSNKLVHLVGYKKDGATATFTLTYKPSSNSAVAATGSNLIFDEGVVTNPTSVNTSTGLVTLTAVGTSGQRVIVLYEHEEVTS